MDGGGGLLRRGVLRGLAFVFVFNAARSTVLVDAGGGGFCRLVVDGLVIMYVRCSQVNKTRGCAGHLS